MPQRIDQDTNRFKQIVRGRIKGHLRKFMQQGELIGRVDGPIDVGLLRNRIYPLLDRAARN